MLNIDHRIKRHLILLNLDRRLSNQILNLLTKWSKGGGNNQSLLRLKQLKLALYHFWAGNPEYLEYAPWFRRSRDRKGLYGPFRHLFKMSPTRKERKRILSIVNTMTVYTANSAEVEKKIDESIDFISSEYKGQWVEPLPRDFNIGIYCQSPDEVIPPSLAGFNTSKPTGRDNIDHKWLDSLMATTHMVHPYQLHLDTSLIKCNPSQNWDDAYQLMDEPVAKLAFLNEGKGKVRTIALPDSEYQIAMLPLHKALGKGLRAIREDCTYDQDEGAQWAQERLRQGIKLHSIDLKSATDRFPRDLQLLFANKAGISLSWTRAFNMIASSPVSTPKGVIRYAVGQPMGLYGSFPLLSIGQHGLVRLAAYNLKVSYCNKYRVLGDDIIIADDALASEYMRLLNHYDIPLSKDKCISSDRFAEFAGFAIFPDGALKGAKPPKGLSSTGSLLSYCRALEQIPKVLLPYHSYLEPLVYGLEENGGLGYNPKGYSYADRDLWYDPIKDTAMDLDAKEVQKWMEFISTLNEVLYSIKKPNEGLLILKNFVDFVEDLKTKVSSDMKFLAPLPGSLDHFIHMDPKFMLGVSSFHKELPKPSIAWVRRKYPYYFMLHDNLVHLRKDAPRSRQDKRG